MYINNVNILGGVSFLNTAPYKSVIQGSLLFAGGSTGTSGSYLGISPGIPIAGGAYTVEGWFQLPNFNNAYGIMGASGAYGMSLFVTDSTTITTDSNGGHGQFSYTVPTMSVNTWYYFALVRNSSNQESLFLGATPGGTATRSTSGVHTNNINYYTSSNPTNQIGTYYGSNWPGYITNLRTVVGNNLYDPNASSIAVPSTQLTQFNVLTIFGIAGGYNSPPYYNQTLTGGSGSGMMANYSTAGNGYVTQSSIVLTNAGSGYQNGDVLTLPNGLGSTVKLSNYNIGLSKYLMLGNSVTLDTANVQTVTSHGTITQTNSVVPF